MATDLEIAREAKLEPIENIARTAGFLPETVSPYGRYVAKIDQRAYADLPQRAKLVLVTAINPTPAGEGKTTVSVALADGMRCIGKNAMLALREPSLGPVFGMKGGATGGGYAQVVPMESINLHFTGDLHAITAANNLLCAMVDNHIQQGNALGIDPRRVCFRHCLDVNDRQLRHIVQGLGGTQNGTPREDGFDITAASEVMATFCLASDLKDLKARLGRIVVARTYQGAPVTAGEVGAAGAMTALLRDAFSPNLIQTIGHTPCLMHGGPFANIAHGCNSVAATRLALRMSDYTVTEAGFGADLGAEKFLDIKCRMNGLWPNAIVLVATVRALKHHGGCPKAELGVPSLEYLEAGSANLARHVENMQSKFGMPVCVAINAFPTDSPEEHQYLRDLCARLGVPCALSEVFAKGGAGGLELAEDVLGILEKRPVRFTYPDDAPVADKVRAVCKNIYGAADVAFSAAAKKQLAELDAGGFGRLPVCIAKTQYSFSDDASLLAAPSGFTMTVRELRLSAGAGFVVVVMGNIMTMPGLPKKPAAEGIDVDENGVISGLF